MHMLCTTAAVAFLWDICTILVSQREDRGLSKDTNKLLESTKSSSIT